jgi:hypothetical protein
MFISADYLATAYGVDASIARFFVDREPPRDNLYWKGKLLYVRPAPGYLFIPLIVDLLFKLGIERQQLLSEEFVSNVEHVCHLSALEETKQITSDEALRRCSDLVKDTCRNKRWFNNLGDYFNNAEGNLFSGLLTPFKALHRGDVFLFSVCALTFADDLMERITEQWFALISTLLLLDDAEDVGNDRVTGDENAFLESGLTADGINKVLELLRKNLHTITTLNPSMARELDNQFIALLNQPHIIQLLNSK